MIEKKKLEEKEASSNHTVNNEYTVLHLCSSHHKDSIVESSAHNEWGNVPGVGGVNPMVRCSPVLVNIREW